MTLMKGLSPQFSRYDWEYVAHYALGFFLKVLSQSNEKRGVRELYCHDILYLRNLLSCRSRWITEETASGTAFDQPTPGMMDIVVPDLARSQG